MVLPMPTTITVSTERKPAGHTGNGRPAPTSFTWREISTAGTRQAIPSAPWATATGSFFWRGRMPFGRAAGSRRWWMPICSVRSTSPCMHAGWCRIPRPLPGAQRSPMIKSSTPGRMKHSVERILCTFTKPMWVWPRRRAESVPTGNSRIRFYPGSRTMATIPFSSWPSWSTPITAASGIRCLISLPHPAGSVSPRT